MRARWILLFLFALGACESPSALRLLPSGAIAFSPPSIYRQWWTLTEQCAGRSESFDAISWFVVPNAATLSDTSTLAGAWYPDGNRIVLAGQAAEWGDLVRHEMLHAILGPTKSKHPRDAFVVRCGGVVFCDAECVSNGGPPAPAPIDARPEPPTTLDVSVKVVPLQPGPGAWDGYFMMIVSARNRADYPVIAQLSPTHDGRPSVSFSYHLRASGTDIFYDSRADVPEVTRFAAGETKQFVFDFRTVGTPAPATRYELSAGTWTFNGAYGGVWAPAPPTAIVAEP